MYIWIYVQQMLWKGGVEARSSVPSRPIETVDRENLPNDLLRATEFIGRPSGVALKILFGNFSLSTPAIGLDRAPDLSPFPRWVSPTLFLRF
jgi:hypothetical protein